MNQRVGDQLAHRDLREYFHLPAQCLLNDFIRGHQPVDELHQSLETDRIAFRSQFVRLCFQRVLVIIAICKRGLRKPVRLALGEDGPQAVFL